MTSKHKLSIPIFLRKHIRDNPKCKLSKEKAISLIQLVCFVLATHEVYKESGDASKTKRSWKT